LSKSKPNISDLVKLAKNGNQQAFSLLLNTYWNEVLAFHLKRNLNENDAEDIVIQTFSKAFDRIETFDEQYVFKTWLIAISKNVYIDFLRKKNAMSSLDMQQTEESEMHKIVDETLSQEDKLIREQNLAELLSHIKKLKPGYQEVIHLRYFQEMSYSEIAGNLQEPINNVKIKLLRAKKLLAEIIKKS
jgi:RNA polymerase sigma-70 factor (ECF subfamily)